MSSKTEEKILKYFEKEEQKKKDKKIKAIKEKKEKNKRKNQKDLINLDEEIIIGVTTKDNKVEKKQKPITRKIKSETKINETKEKKAVSRTAQKKKDKPLKKVQTKKNEDTIIIQTKYQKDREEKKQRVRKINKKSKVKKFVKWLFLFVCLAGAIIYFLTTSVFDITEIIVIDNAQISDATYISLSQIQLGENTFKLNKKEIEKRIKENAYVERVQITRELPSKVILTIEERKPTFMLELPEVNMFMYMNNQGYMLEISGEVLPVPIITGIQQKTSELIVGQRLVTEDLKKIETILKVMDAARNNGLESSISTIDITDEKNYKLILNQETKTIYIGDETNINTKMLYLKKILEKEKGLKGEAFINDIDNVYFSETI